MSPGRARWWRGGPAGCVALLAGMLAAADVDGATLRVQYSDDRLSVTADGVPLSEVLSEVARQTGLQIGEFETLSTPVTVSLAGVPLREALRQLLRNLDYVLIEDQLGGTQTATTVLIFAPTGRSSGTASLRAAAELRATVIQPDPPLVLHGPAETGEAGPLAEKNATQYGLSAFPEE